MSINSKSKKKAVEQFTDETVTLDQTNYIIFVGEHLSESQKNKIEEAIDPEKIWEPDSKITRIDL